MQASTGGVVPIGVPTACPSCGGQTQARGDFLYCANPDQCEAVIKGRVAYFCSVIDLQGLGDKHLSGLIQKNLLRAPADLYALTEEQLEQLQKGLESPNSEEWKDMKEAQAEFTPQEFAF